MSRSNCADLEDGRGSGGRDMGDEGLRGEGEDGLDRDLEVERVFVGGEDIGLVDMMGDGA